MNEICEFSLVCVCFHSRLLPFRPYQVINRTLIYRKLAYAFSSLWRLLEMVIWMMRKEEIDLAIFGMRRKRKESIPIGLRKLDDWMD